PLRAGALLIASLLIGLAFFRPGSFSMEVHPSGEVLQGSVTLLLTGAYLLTVGVLAQLLASMGKHTGFPFRALVVLMSLVLLLIVLLSDRIRQWSRRLISRHFKRPLYNYRRVWMAFTEQTT